MSENNGIDKKNISESLVYFFDEKVCPQADVIYRFCYGACLNLEVSKKIVLSTIEGIVSDLENLSLYDDAGLKVLLLYYAFKNLKSFNQEITPDASKYSKLVGSLNTDQRALFMAVDILGLSFSEASRIFSKEEESLRTDIGPVREYVLGKI